MTRTHAARSVTVSLAIALAMLAACGGKSSSPTTPPTGGGAGADGARFEASAVRDALAAMPVPDTCGGADAGASLGALFEQQRAALGTEAEIDVDIKCRAETPGPGQWECTWSAFTKPSGVVDPDDPCAGQGGSGWQIITQVDAAGAIVPGTVVCNAPG